MAGVEDARPDLGFVIVTWNCRQDIARCLPSVLGGVFDHRLEVVVADNDSADGTAELVAERFPEVELVAMGRNAGFAAATNAGMGRTTARHVVLLNPDTVVDPGALDALVAFADERPAAGVVAPALCNPDGSDQGTARSFPTPAAGLFGRRSPLTRLFPENRWSRRFLSGREHVGDEPFRCDWASGACLLVPRRVVDEVGALDEGYFLYWEDADWCRRIHDAGYEVWTVPKARVTHDEGGTRGHAWPTPVIRSFHAGAYRYWRTHHAPQAWNPARWAAAGALGARAGALVARHRLADLARRRHPATVHPPAASHTPDAAPASHER